MAFSTWIIFFAVVLPAILSLAPAGFLAISNSVGFGCQSLRFFNQGGDDPRVIGAG